MNINKKEAVLLMGRGSLYTAYIQGLINVFSEKYTVLVVDPDDYQYSGDHIRLDSDYYDYSSGFNDEDIKGVEKELGLNLVHSYSNYLYYGRLAQEANIDYSSYWFTKEKIARLYYSSYVFFKKIFDEYDVKFAYHDTIDQIYSFVLEAFSQKIGFGFYHTLIIPGIFNNRLLNGTTRRVVNPQFIHELSLGTPPTSDEEAYIDGIISAFDKEKPTMDYMKVRPTGLFNRFEVVSLFKNIKYMPYAVKRLHNRLYIRQKVKGFSLGEAGKYILFFFAHQPESVTTSAAQEYVDQWKIVEELAIHAPSDINIVIKDHPFGYGWRGKEYFERLLRLPNVKMAPVNYPGKELIKNAEAVLTINGSVGLEAMMYGVSSFTLGDAWYSHPEYIQNLKKPTDIFPKLSDPPLTDQEKRNVLLAAYRASVDFKVEYTPEVTPEKVQSGERLAEHMMTHKDFYFRRYEDIKGFLA